MSRLFWETGTSLLLGQRIKEKQSQGEQKQLPPINSEGN